MMKPLTQRDLEVYHKDGFLLIKNFFDQEWIKGIKREVDGLHQEMWEKPREGVGIIWEDLPEGEAPIIRQLMGSQNVVEGISEMVESPKLMGAIEQLLGEESEFFHSKLMMKAAHRGTFTPWHADWNYWSGIFREPKQMNAFVAIDPSTLENGCIRYVPGSHQWYDQPVIDEQAKGFGVGYPGGLDAFDAVPVIMEPGDVAFHGSYTIHASEGNRSSGSRIMNTLAYTAKGQVLDEEQARRSFVGQRLQLTNGG